MLTFVAALALAQPLAPRIHCVSDISQEFTFYMDGRFARQYLADSDADVRNWGTLHKQDLSNVNLLVLSAGDTRVPFSPATLGHIRKYVEGGGGLLMMSDGRAVTEGQKLPLNYVGDLFGAAFTRSAAAPPISAKGPGAPETVEFKGGSTLVCIGPWQTLAADANGETVLAMRTLGKGRVLAASRGLFGSNPDASDPLNQNWFRTLLREVASGKQVDAAKPPQGNFAELTKQVGPLTLEFHEGTQQFADAISKEYAEIRPALVQITGVEPSPGMIARMLMLPTGGGGFSSGERIAIGAWWGDYPKHRYPMVELIAHEAGHSWVLPHPEPVWNEPIATYLGILVGRKFGMPEADATLKRTIEGARKLDQEMSKVDISKPGAPNAVVWGKSFFVFEEIERKHGPGTMAKYFRTKRKLVPAGAQGYSMDDSVAVWSAAVGQDLYPWFRSLGFDVSRERTKIPL